MIAYNSMSKHLRRILSAKSVIESKNKNYLLKKKRCKIQETSDKTVCPKAIDELINRLAYDTLHHPRVKFST